MTQRRREPALKPSSREVDRESSAADHSHHRPARRNPDVALQLGLGIRPERHRRPDRGHPDHLTSDGTVVKSAASFRGHPAHVILVDFPIAFWIGSFLADLAYLWRGDSFLFDMAWYLMGAGIAFAVVAAVAGSIDYFGSVPPHSEARSTALLHGLLNVGATVLYGF